MQHRKPLVVELETIALSALQHWHYCPRQCGLIHLEQVFDDNVHTLRGQAVHARVDQPGVETAKGVRVERALPLWHDALGLVGKSDVVEYLAARVRQLIAGGVLRLQYKQRLSAGISIFL